MDEGLFPRALKLPNRCSGEVFPSLLRKSKGVMADQELIRFGEHCAVHSFQSVNGVSHTHNT